MYKYDNVEMKNGILIFIFPHYHMLRYQLFDHHLKPTHLFPDNIFYF